MTLDAHRLVATVVLAFVCLFAPRAQAGSEATKVGVDKYGDQPIREFALRLNDQLDARRANVAIIARCGRPRGELPSGVRYTHVAIAVFEAVRGADGAPFHTYAVYNLYQDSAQEDRSYLKQDLVYHFIAGIDEPDVAVCIPIEPLQKRLLAVIRSAAYRDLYIPSYNLVANPWADRYDNCVTHTLKICFAAIYATSDRERINANIRAYFTPTPIRLGPLRSIGAHFMTAIKHDDAAPTGLQTATYDSLHTFLQGNQLLRDSFTLRIN